VGSLMGAVRGVGSIMDPGDTSCQAVRANRFLSRDLGQIGGATNRLIPNANEAINKMKGL